PLATRVDAFERYQKEEAWTWEHLALARARPIAGDEVLCRRVEAVIDEVVSREREPQALKNDVLEMRGRIQSERGDAEHWSFKTVPGGLIDVEFAAQFAILSGLERRPGEPAMQTLRRAGEAAPDAGWMELAEASEFQSALMQFIRVAYGSSFQPDQAPAGFRQFLSRQMKEPDFSVLSARLSDIQDAAEKAFFRVLDGGDCKENGEGRLPERSGATLR
ncbi:MAG TPA: bifunctional [glutamine synthetase] adenylyltransferase/[glutamine synthetase]-adenylyl-L-tyrosine phosphorylase, partial [Afifellaceae bacterium]|nr:bifunctional [glutamine synthetase] adenylyltransferase/[glutamine synthetase]-adenylyl-L-tyrosine phosphorylase [Afifellaceae bacterium]